VRGRVQGVFFRATCARRARSLGIGGWVGNRPDGAVEAVFEGERREVEELVDWCRRGPERAEVTSVEVTEEPPTGDASFVVSG